MTSSSFQPVCSSRMLLNKICQIVNLIVNNPCVAILLMKTLIKLRFLLQPQFRIIKNTSCGQRLHLFWSWMKLHIRTINFQKIVIQNKTPFQHNLIFSHPFLTTPFRFIIIIMINLLKQANFRIDNPLWRVWLLFKKRSKIKKEWTAQLQITTKGITILATTDDGLQKVIQYLDSQTKKKSYRLVTSEEQKQKLDQLEIEIQSCRLATLENVAKEFCTEDLNLQFTEGYFVVFRNSDADKIDQILHEYYSEGIRLKQSQLITLLCMKVFEAAKPQYGCKVNMLEEGVVIIKGPEENVSKFIEILKQLKSQYQYKIALSKKQSSLNSQIINILTKRLSTQKKILLIPCQKIKKRIENHKCKTLTAIYQKLIEDHQNFILITFPVDHRQQISEIIQKTKDQYESSCEDNSTKLVSEPERKGQNIFSELIHRKNRSRTPLKRQQSPDKFKRNGEEFSSYIQRRDYEEDDYEYRTPRNRFSRKPRFEDNYRQPYTRNEHNNEIYYQNSPRSWKRDQQDQRYTHYDRYKQTRSQQNSRTNKKIPIHPLVHQGFKKFLNFKSKMEDLKNTYRVIFNYPIIDKKSYIQFTSNPNCLKVYQDLNFFLQKLQIFTYRINTTNNYFNYEELSDEIQYLVQNQNRFNGIVVSRIWMDGFLSKIQIFYSREKAIDKDQDQFVRQLKLLLKDTSTHLTLIPRQTIKIDISKYFQYN